MDDQPPPKKKSRFFVGGKAKLNSFLHPLKKHEKNGDPTPTPSASQSGPPSPARVDERAEPDISTVIPASTSDNLVDKNNQEPNQGRDIVQTSERTDASNQTPLPSPTTPTEVLENLTVRDKRRNGIYGAEALLQFGQEEAKKFIKPGLGGISASHPKNLEQLAEKQNVSLLQTSLNTHRPQPFTFRAAHLPAASALGTGRQRPPTPIPTSLGQHENIYQDTGPLGSSNNNFMQTLPQPGTNALAALAQKRLVQAQSTKKFVDLDRDAAGKLLTQLRRHSSANLPGEGITNLPFHAAAPQLRRLRRSSGTPANMYTSPGRVAHASVAAQMARKRKRPDAMLPPPAYIYIRTNDPNFNVFNGILLYPEIVFHLASRLPVKILIALYSISRDFHTILDTRFTTVILSQALAKAPESSRTFQFRCYSHLCRMDAAARIPHPDPLLAASGLIRKVPSLRWLQMVMHREKVVHEIMAIMAEDGVPLPARCSNSIKKVWFLLDIPDNSRRIGFIHNRTMFTDLDLYFAMAFFIKLDMRFNDPAGAEKRDGLRKMILSQKTFSVLASVLRREKWQKKGDILAAWVQWKYEPREDERDLKSIFGIKLRDCGKLKYEYWGRRTTNILGEPVKLLLRPDQLVMREAIKRGRRFTRHFLRCMLYGYVRPDTLESYAPRAYGRQIIELRNDEYGLNDVVGGIGSLRMEDGGDELLDIGPGRQGSPWTSVPDKPTQEELETRKKLDAFIEVCMKWSEQERKDQEEEGVMDLDD